MKLLLLAYYFPPTRVVAAQRWYHLYHNSQEYFESVHVLTTDNRRLFPQDSSLEVDGERIKEIPTFDLRTKLAELGKAGVHLDFKTKSTPWGTSMRRLYHSYPFVLWVGDGGRAYRLAALRWATGLVQDEGITHIVSSFRPWADHWVAARLKRRFPHLHWAADFRDLPVDALRKDVWWPGLQRWWMRRIIRSADRLTTVSEGLAHSLADFHPKVELVYNAMPKSPSQFMTAPGGHNFTITYTGSLYPGLQSPALLFRNLRYLINEGVINPVHIQLRYAGKDRELWRQWTRQHGLGHLSLDYGEVDYRTATDLQKESQLNLLLSWSGPQTKGILTAKLADYLAASRPIVALINGPHDAELEHWVVSTGAGRLFAEDTENSNEQIQQFLLDTYRTWQFSGSLLWRIDPTKLAAFTWPKQAEELWGNA